MSLLTFFKRDYVLLVLHDGKRLKCPVEWLCGVPYAYPYLEHTRCRLDPGGKITGQSYVSGWEPATPAMLAHYGPNWPPKP